VLLEALREGIIYDFPEDPPMVRAQLTRGIRLLHDAGVTITPELVRWEDVRQFLSEERAGAGIHYSVPLRDNFPGIIEEFAKSDPQGAALPAMLLVREWERISPPWLMRSVEGARDWGWGKLVVPLARILLLCDATWSGQLIVDWSAGILKRVGTDRLNGPAADALYELGTLASQFHQQYREHRDEVAWLFATEIKRGDPVVIACLAALYWTLGDVQQARELAEGRFKPRTAPLTVLLDGVTGITTEDPMIGAVVSCLRHSDVYVQMDDGMRRRLTRWRGNSVPGTAFESLREQYGMSPSEIYGHVLVRWFLAAITDADVQAARALAYAVAKSSHHVVYAARTYALANLVVPAEEDDEPWRRLASWSARQSELQHWAGVNGRYEGPLDLALSYLDCQNDDVLRAVEEQRWGTLAESVWHAVPEMLQGSSGRAAQEVSDILEELRILRYISILPRLPNWASRVIRKNWRGDSIDSKEWSDTDQAYDKAMEHRTRLREIAREMELADADIGGLPLLGGTSLEELAAVLE
jgi:hypothetical protein